MALSDVLRSPFSFLFARSNKNALLSEYVIREHANGRSLHEILQDPYIRNRTSDGERERLLDNPEIVRALGADTIAGLRSTLGQR